MTAVGELYFHGRWRDPDWGRRLEDPRRLRRVTMVRGDVRKTLSVWTPVVRSGSLVFAFLRRAFFYSFQLVYHCQPGYRSVLVPPRREGRAEVVLLD